jgi:hypothetical protein
MKFLTLSPICISPSFFVYMRTVCLRLLVVSVYHTLRILPPKPPPSQIGVWIMRWPLWYSVLFYSVQSSQQSQCDNACVEFPNDRFQMNYSLRHPSSEVDLQSRPNFRQTSDERAERSMALNSRKLLHHTSYPYGPSTTAAWDV